MHVLTSASRLAHAQRRAGYRAFRRRSWTESATHHPIQSRTGRSCAAPSKAGQASSATPTTNPPTPMSRRTGAPGPGVGARGDGEADGVGAEQHEAQHEGDDPEVVHQPRRVQVAHPAAPSIEVAPAARPGENVRIT